MNKYFFALLVMVCPAVMNAGRVNETLYGLPALNKLVTPEDANVINIEKN